MAVSLQRLELVNFRNFASAALTFSHTWTGFTGPNGTGKTSLLEAVYFACRLRGFRNESWTRLRRWDTAAGQINLDLSGSRIEQRQVCWQDDRLQAFEDGDELTRRAWVQRVPVFGYRPDDDLFFHDEPKERRKYLDWFCSYLDPGYIDLVSDYEQTLRQRNSALRIPGVRDQEFTAWEDILARTGAAVVEIRRKGMAMIADAYSKLWSRLERDAAAVEYVCRGGLDVQDNALCLADQRRADRRRGWTGYGPHRDDLRVSFADRPIRESGSQGYRKLAIILLSAACGSVVPLGILQQPLFYLDDIDGELDDDNERRLFEILSDLPFQVMISGVRRPRALESTAADQPIDWRPLRSVHS